MLEHKICKCDEFEKMQIETISLIQYCAVNGIIYNSPNMITTGSPIIYQKWIYCPMCGEKMKDEK